MKNPHWMMAIGVATIWVGSWAAAQEASDRPAKIGFHAAVYDDNGKLLPRIAWDDAIRCEVNWYLKCPLDAHGYPLLASTTFMDGQYRPSRMDSIPCTQDGMGIISYLKYWEYTGRTDGRVLNWARKLGDYLVNETLTPDEGAYPRFTRSTGYYSDYPLFRSSQGDARYGRNTIQPDKGGIAGYALVRLYEATSQRAFLEQARHNADVLVKNMRDGNATQSPWPYRVNSVTGEHWSERSSNMVYILRLFDALIQRGDDRYRVPRERLWAWMREYQIPSSEDPEKCLWVQFFEDYAVDTNRNSWSALETARYLIEQKETLDPNWKADAERLIQYALKYFSSPAPGGVTLMGEQDDDKSPWGGACSKLGGVAALFYAAGGGEKYRELAYRNLSWMTYFIDNDGCPAQMAKLDSTRRGGWQEDCHTDVLHNFVDAIQAVPEWAAGPSGPSERQQIAALLAGWKAALLASDIPALLKFYAGDPSKGGDKTAIMAALQEAIDDGEVKEATLVVEDATITIDGEKAEVAPIAIGRRNGVSTLRLAWTKQDGHWLISAMGR